MDIILIDVNVPSFKEIPPSWGLIFLWKITYIFFILMEWKKHYEQTVKNKSGE